MRFEAASQHVGAMPVRRRIAGVPATAIARELFDQVDQFADLTTAAAIVRRKIIQIALDEFRQAPIDQQANVMGVRVKLGIAQRESRPVDRTPKDSDPVGMMRRGGGEASPDAVFVLAGAGQ